MSPKKDTNGKHFRNKQNWNIKKCYGTDNVMEPKQEIKLLDFIIFMVRAKERG